MRCTKQDCGLIGHATRKTMQAVCLCLAVMLLFPSMAFASNASKYYDYVLENNQRMRQEDNNPENYLTMEQSDFKELSEKIVSGISGDYQKVEAIYNWVCENIYYDYYAYETGDFLTNSPEYTVEWLLENKRGVCSYYAAIFERLVRAQSIPCRTVVGYAVDYQNDSTNSNIDFNARTYTLIQDQWTEANYLSDANHAWNEAYVNGQWLNIDTTWDSCNEYTIDKKYVKKAAWHAYFDISDEQFAKDHKIMEYGNYQEIAEREYEAFMESWLDQSDRQGNQENFYILDTEDIWEAILENTYQSESRYYKSESSTTTVTTTTITSADGVEIRREITVEGEVLPNFEEMEDLVAWFDEIMEPFGIHLKIGGN